MRKKLKLPPEAPDAPVPPVRRLRLFWGPIQIDKKNSRGWTRTSDKVVNSHPLYQLSYAGMFLHSYQIDNI